MKILNLSDSEFQRLLGIKRPTFNKMLEIVTEAHAIAKRKGGVQSRLSIQDRLMMTIEFWNDIKKETLLIIDTTGTKIQGLKKVSTKRNLFRKKKTK